MGVDKHYLPVVGVYNPVCNPSDKRTRSVTVNGVVAFHPVGNNGDNGILIGYPVHLLPEELYVIYVLSKSFQNIDCTLYHLRNIVVDEQLRCILVDYLIGLHYRLHNKTFNTSTVYNAYWPGQ